MKFWSTLFLLIGIGWSGISQTTAHTDSINKELKAIHRQFSKSIYTDLNASRPFAFAYFEMAYAQGSIKHQVKAHHVMSTYYKAQRILDSAKYHGYMAHKMAKSLHDTSGVITTSNMLGLVFEEEGKLDSALAYYLESLLLAEAIQNTVVQVRAYINLGLTYELKREYKQSIHFLNKALELSLEHGFKPYYPIIYYNMGNVYASINDEHRALFNYRKSLDASNKLNNTQRYVNAATALANQYLAIEKPDSALHFIALAHRHDSLLSPPSFYALQLAESQVYYALDKQKMAYEKLAQCDAFFEQQRDTLSWFYSLVYLAKVELANHRLQESVKYANFANDKLAASIDEAYHDQLAWVLYEANKESGQTAQALQNLEWYSQLKSTKRNAEELNQVVRLTLDREFRKKHVADSVNNAIMVAQIKRDHAQEVRYEKAIKSRLALGLFALGVILFIIAWAYRVNRRNALELAEKNTIIEQALKDKEVLMNEIHHRVKNNMQMVSSLLQLKARATTDREAEEALIDSQKRIESMQLAHQKMYQNNDFEHINVVGYTQEILYSLTGMETADGDVFEVRGAPIKLPIEKAQAVGFILHELITNSLKYAWEIAKNRSIRISLNAEKGQVMIQYKDNGKGIPSDLVARKNSLGRTLIFSFVDRKLRGTISESHTNGVQYIIKFASHE